MELALSSQPLRRFIFLLAGLVAIYYLISDYGLQRLLGDFSTAGFSLIILICTFIPTLLLYSIAWLAVTDLDHVSLALWKKVLLFFKMMAISIAWNNLTPFLKVGGEPYKYFMLTQLIDRPKAIASTLVYNIVHLYATILTFMLTSILIPALFNIPHHYHLYFYLFFFLCLITLLSSGMMIKSFNKMTFKMRGLKNFLIKTRWSLRQANYSYKRNKIKITFALCCEVLARFIEGITFYYAFYIINHPIALSSAFFLEVGRTLVDTLFFFIPFQLGSREEGIRVFLESVMHTTSTGFLSAVFMYRFVEIAWIVIGYLLWVLSKTRSHPASLSRKESGLSQ